MAAIFLGLAALVAILLAIRLFVSADPHVLARAVHMGGAIVLGVIAIAALLYGRLFLGLSAALLVFALYGSRNMWRPR